MIELEYPVDTNLHGLLTRSEVVRSSLIETLCNMQILNYYSGLFFGVNGPVYKIRYE